MLCVAEEKPTATTGSLTDRVWKAWVAAAHALGRTSVESHHRWSSRRCPSRIGLAYQHNTEPATCQPASPILTDHHVFFRLCSSSANAATQTSAVGRSTRDRPVQQIFDETDLLQEPKELLLGRRGALQKLSLQIYTQCHNGRPEEVEILQRLRHKCKR